MVVASAFPVNASPLLDSGEFADCRIVILERQDATANLPQPWRIAQPSSVATPSPSRPSSAAGPPQSPKPSRATAGSQMSPKPKIWLGQLPPSPARTAPQPTPQPAGPAALAIYDGHRVVLAAASGVFRQQLGSEGDVTIRLRTPSALPAAQLLLSSCYGRPLDWPSLPPATLNHLIVLAHDHGLPPLKQAAATRLMHLLASKRPAGPPGPHITAAASNSSIPTIPTTAAPSTAVARGLGCSAAAAAVAPSPYVDALCACLALPPEVACADVCVQLMIAARTLLLDAFQDLEAAWQVAPLRRAFLGLPLAAAAEVLASDALAANSEAAVLLAAMAYDASRGSGDGGGGGSWAPTGGKEAGAAAGLGPESSSIAGGGKGGTALSTAERLALYGSVRWHLLQVDGRSHERNSFFRNALQRMPHLLPLLEHGTAASGTGGAFIAATGGLGVAPHPAAVAELAAAAAACGPYQPAASLLDLSQLAQSLTYTRQQRLAAAAGGSPAVLPYMELRAGVRPRPTGHLQTAVHLQMDVPYNVLRQAVGRVAARMEDQRRQKALLERHNQNRQRQGQAQGQQQRGGNGDSGPGSGGMTAGGVSAATAAALPLAVAPVSAVAVEEDLVSAQLVYHQGYWWQMVVSLGPLCRYRMALSDPIAPPISIASAGRVTPAAAAAAAAIVAHETDGRLVCYVGVRPLLLLTEAEVAAAAGRAVPAGWAGGGVEGVEMGAAAAARLLPSSVYVENLDVWNERELPLGKASLGPTCFSRGSGFKGSTTLFEVGPTLAEEGYWAKVVSGPEGALRVRARVVGVH